MSQKNDAYVPGHTKVSTDIYYKGSGISVINNDYAPCRRGKPGDAPPAPKLLKYPDGNTSTDKYYSSTYGSPVPAVPGGRVAVGNGVDAVVRPIRINGIDDIKLSLMQLITALRTGSPKVYVELAPELFQPFNVQLDLATARNEIPNDRRKDIYVRELPRTVEEAAAQTFGKIEPDSVPVAEEEDDSELSEEAMRGILGIEKTETDESVVPADVIDSD